jgi:peptidoglycan/xylan/chitin deacetylase (PgdA/CDA1 family)
MKTYLNFLILLVLDKLGINAIFRFLNRNKVIILWYHGICDDNFELLKGYDERHIPKSLFSEQLNFLKQKGYVFVTLSDLIDIFSNKKQTKKIIIITFDDGFRNVVTNAYPIMKRFNAKGCFYLVSNLIGGNELLWTDYIETIIRNSKRGKFQFVFKGKTVSYDLNTKESYQHTMKDIKRKLRSISDRLRKEHIKQFNDIKIDDVPKEFTFSNWEEIKNLDPAILEVGSHTKNHPNCTNLISNDELIDEIRDSKVKIEQMIGHEINHFCYPAGSYNDEVIKNVKKYGYKTAVTIDEGLNDQNTDLYKLKRILVTEDFLLFKANTSGSLIFIRRLKNLF